MSQKEKTMLVHWYYSIVEWNNFLKQDIRRKILFVLIEAGFVWILVFFTVYFGRNETWEESTIIGLGLAVLYGLLKYYIHYNLKWKKNTTIEVYITDNTVTINDRLIVFQGNGQSLRNVTIKEIGGSNMLVLLFERGKEKKLDFEEIRIPVPKGKLREAVQLVDLLSMRWGLLTEFG